MRLGIALQSFLHYASYIGWHGIQLCCLDVAMADGNLLYELFCFVTGLGPKNGAHRDSIRFPNYTQDKMVEESQDCGGRELRFSQVAQAPAHAHPNQTISRLP